MEAGDLVEAIGIRFGVPTPADAAAIEGGGTLTIALNDKLISEHYDSIFDAMQGISEKLMVVEVASLVSGHNFISALKPEMFTWDADKPDEKAVKAAAEVIQKVMKT